MQYAKKLGLSYKGANLMSLLNIFKKKNTESEPKSSQNTLEQDIKASCEWVIKALNSSGYKADYTLESMKEVDRFFDEQNTPDGILSNNRGQILFPWHHISEKLLLNCMAANGLSTRMILTMK